MIKCIKSSYLSEKWVCVYGVADKPYMDCKSYKHYEYSNACIYEDIYSHCTNKEVILLCEMVK